MNYGEQRYKENIKELTPEQKAKQTLILEALREQTAYERKKRRETVAACKRGLDIISKALIIMASLLVLSMVVSCSKEDLEVPCVWTELTIAGDTATEWVCLPKV